MLRTPDCTGQMFGRWTALRRVQNQGRKPHWECRCECGAIGVVAGTSLRRGASRSCGCIRYEKMKGKKGAESIGWGGGRTKSSTGYILVQTPGHPAAQANGYVPEHRLVMEKIIGRLLRPEETVHHVNGRRDDNRQENLELWTSRQPRGQRVADLIEWAEEILRLYKDEKIPLTLSRHIGRVYAPNPLR